MTRDNTITKLYSLRTNSIQARNELIDVEDFLEQEREVLKDIIIKLTNLTNVQEANEIIRDIKEIL